MSSRLLFDIEKEIADALLVADDSHESAMAEDDLKEKARLYNKAKKHYEIALINLRELQALGKGFDLLKLIKITWSVLIGNYNAPSLSYPNFIEQLTYLKEFSPQIKVIDEGLYNEIVRFHAHYFLPSGQVNEKRKVDYLNKHQSMYGLLSDNDDFYSLPKMKDIHKLKMRGEYQISTGHTSLVCGDEKNAKLGFKKGCKNLLKAIALSDQLKAQELELEEAVQDEAHSYNLLLFGLAQCHIVSYKKFMVYYQRMEVLLRKYDPLRTSQEFEMFLNLEKRIQANAKNFKIQYETSYKTENAKDKMDSAAEAIENKLRMLEHLQSNPTIPYAAFLHELYLLNTSVEYMQEQYPRFHAIYPELLNHVGELNARVDREKGAASKHKIKYEKRRLQSRDVPPVEAAAAAASSSSVSLESSSGSLSLFASAKKSKSSLKKTNNEITIVYNPRLDQVSDALHEKVQAMIFEKVNEQDGLQLAGNAIIKMARILEMDQGMRLAHAALQKLITYSLMEIAADLGNEEGRRWKENLLEENLVRTSLKYNNQKIEEKFELTKVKGDERMKLIGEFEKQRTAEILSKYSHPSDEYLESKDSNIFDLKSFIADTLENLFFEITTIFSRYTAVKPIISEVLWDFAIHILNGEIPLPVNPDHLARILIEGASDLGSEEAKDWLRSNSKPGRFAKN